MRPNPSWLNKTAKELFKRLEKELPAPLSEGKRESLAILCEAYSLYRAAVADLDENGFIIRSDRGWKQNPALQARKQGEDSVHRWMGNLELTQQQIQEAADDLDNFMEGK